MIRTTKNKIQVQGSKTRIGKTLEIEAYNLLLEGGSLRQADKKEMIFSAAWLAGNPPISSPSANF